MKIISLFCLALFMYSSSVFADRLEETRYCGPPDRYASGVIKRSSAVLSAFVKIHPCPATGLHEVSCKGWQINHVIPLACGGCDSVSNMDWMPESIKTCSDPHCRDRFERKIYALNPPIADTAACVNKIVP